jgi:hypothetical protein
MNYKCLEVLDKGWKKYLDPTTNLPFYFNEITQQSLWEEPEGSRRSLSGSELVNQLEFISKPCTQCRGWGLFLVRRNGFCDFCSRNLKLFPFDGTVDAQSILFKFERGQLEGQSRRRRSRTRSRSKEKSRHGKSRSRSKERRGESHSGRDSKGEEWAFNRYGPCLVCRGWGKDLVNYLFYCNHCFRQLDDDKRKRLLESNLQLNQKKQDTYEGTPVNPELLKFREMQERRQMSLNSIYDKKIEEERRRNDSNPRQGFSGHRDRGSSGSGSHRDRGSGGGHRSNHRGDHREHRDHRDHRDQRDNRSHGRGDSQHQSDQGGRPVNRVSQGGGGKWDVTTSKSLPEEGFPIHHERFSTEPQQGFGSRQQSNIQQSNRSENFNSRRPPDRFRNNNNNPPPTRRREEDDPMDPSSYTDAPKGRWSDGLALMTKAADETASGPLFQSRPYMNPSSVLQMNSKKAKMY